MKLVCGLSVLSLVAVVGLAQTPPPGTLFLTPTMFSVRTGETVKLQYSSGTAAPGQPAPWPADVEWLFIRASATQENRHDVRAAPAAENAVAIPIREAGVTVVGADRKPAPTEMTGAELREFLRAHVAPEAAQGAGDLPPPDAKVGVRVVSSAKTLIRAAAAPGAGTAGGSAVAASKTGQAVEIQPLVDPTVLRVGSDLPLRVFVVGGQKSGAKVQATSPNGKVETILTDPTGSGHIRIHAAGLWRIEFHHAAPLENDPAGGWAICTATLTFEVPGKGAAR